MSTPRRLQGALENYFGGADQEIMQEILDILELHFSGSAASPWIFSHDAQPEVGVEVICLDPDEQGRPAGPITLCSRSPEDDWTMPEFVFWWAPIPPLPKGGAQSDPESGARRMNTGFAGGAQTLDQDSLIAWDLIHAALVDTYAGLEARVTSLRARCAPHDEIQAAVHDAEAGRTKLLEHGRAILALHNEYTNKEGSHA